MKINMAESDYFDIGMIVACTTCHGQKFQGEIMAFDLPTRVLAVKIPAASGKPGNHDVRLVNMQYVSEVTVIKEAAEPALPLPNLNIAKLGQRIKSAVEDKTRKVNYIGVGVSPQAQKLFHHITKTFDDVKWDDQDIIVLNQVRITAPYSPEHCHGQRNNSQQATQHVQKIVDKYYRDEAASRESSVQRESS